MSILHLFEFNCDADPSCSIGSFSNPYRNKLEKLTGISFSGVAELLISKSLILTVLTLSLLSGCGGGGSTSVPADPFGTEQLGAIGAITSASSVVIDISGNVYVAGVTYGNLDGNTLTGTSDLFVTKYDSTGTKRYTRQLGVTGAGTFGSSIATDTNGNVYVTGFTRGGLDGNTLAGTDDMFLVKYDAAGTKIYTKQLGGTGHATYGNSVATDISGNIYVTGQTYVNLDGNILTGTSDLFLTKYDANGTKKYTKQVGLVVTNTAGNSVATDANGNVYVTGFTSAGLDGNTLTGSYDFFLIKYDAAGTRIYTNQLGVIWEGTFGTSVAPDANGNVYVTGYTHGGLDGNTLTGPVGTADCFLTKYNAAGIKQFTRQMGAGGPNPSTTCYSVATDESGNVYVSGSTDGSLDNNLLTGYFDYFLTKYDASGIRKYTRQQGVTGVYTFGSSVATDTGGNVYVAGATDGGLNGNTPTGLRDLFLIRYDAAGNKN